MRRKTTIAYVQVAVALAAGLVIVAPLIVMLNVALKNEAEAITNLFGLVEAPRFRNFLDVYRQTDMLRLFLNSILLTGAAATGNTLLAGLAAFPISRGLVYGHRTLYRVMTMGIFLPPGIIPLYAIMSGLGLARTYAGFALMGSGMHLTIGIFVLVSFARNIPKTLDEAAFAEGCGYGRYFFSFVLPLMKPALVTVWLLRALQLWNDFLYPFVFLRASQRTLPTGLYVFRGQYLTNWPLLMAAAALVALPMLVIYIFLQRRMIDGLVSGAVKG